MYTEENMDYGNNYGDDNYQNDYVDNDDPNKKNNSIGVLLLRILIIFVCLLLVIWIISKFIGGKDNNKKDSVVLNNNITTIRLAAEKYFFLENNLEEVLDKTVTITLSEMNNKGMVAAINDYRGNACSVKDNESYVTLKKTSVAYELVVKLTCDDSQKEVTYYYDLKTGECLSCSGNTYMDGSLVLDDSSDENDEETDNTQSTKDEIEKLNINCNSWSDWTTLKLDDSKLLVRTRTMYKGYKQGEDTTKKVYGEWSDWMSSQAITTDSMEVETKEEVVTSWSENKTTTNSISNSDTIKIVDTQTTGGDRVCKTITKNVREEISASKYLEYNAKGIIVAVHDTYYKNSCGDDCKTSYTKVYDVTYKKDVTSCSGSKLTTTYTYQELITQNVTMYRYRTVTNEVVESEKTYTDWVEKLEEGYTKTEERVEYSYKDSVCKG